MNTPTEYLPLTEAARMAGFHPDTLKKLIYDGRLGESEGIRKVFGRWKVHWPTFKRIVMESGRYANA